MIVTYVPCEISYFLKNEGGMTFGCDTKTHRSREWRRKMNNIEIRDQMRTLIKRCTLLISRRGISRDDLREKSM